MSCFEDDAVKVEKPEDEMIFSEPVDFVENLMSESTEKITVGDIPIVLQDEGKSKINKEVNGVDLDSKNKAAEDTITVGDIGIVLPEDGKFKNDKEVDLGALHKASKIEEANSLGDSKTVAEKQKSVDSGKEVGKIGDKDKSDKAKTEDKGEKIKKDKSNANDSDDKLKKEQKKSKGSDHEEKVKEKKVKKEKNEVAKLKRKLEKIDLKMARIMVKKEDYLKRLENALEKKRLDDELACKTQQWENHIQSELISMGVSELNSQFSKLQTSADKA